MIPLQGRKETRRIRKQQGTGQDQNTALGSESEFEREEAKEMGKVTNALLKAGRWTDQNGRAVPQQAPRKIDIAPSNHPAPIEKKARPVTAAAIRHAAQVENVPDPEAIDLLEAAQPAPHQPAPVSKTFSPIPVLQTNRLQQPAIEGPIQGAIQDWAVSPSGSQTGDLQIEHRPRPVELITDRCKTISLSPSRLDPALAVLTGNDPAANEKYQSLAVRLFNLTSRLGTRTIMVTSALEGEGKTTVAANIAALMAKSADRRVLLIDADSRRPSIARSLGIAPANGWAELAAGRCDPADAIYRLAQTGLYVCANAPGGVSGDRTRKPGANLEERLAVAGSAGLTSFKPEQLLEDLKRHFSLIIIDTPPILAFAEAQRVAAIADGSILVVRAASTNHSAVTDALKLIPKDRRLGVVLNQSTDEEESSYYGARKSARTVRARA